MPDVAVAVQQILPTGLVEVPTGSLSVSDTYESENDGGTFIHILNGGGSPDTVTIISNKTVGGLAVADQAVVVAAGTEQLIGPFPPDIYNNSDGQIQWTHSFITTVTHAALHL